MRTKTANAWADVPVIISNKHILIIYDKTVSEI